MNEIQMSDEADLKITVTDVNDNAPVYPGHLPIYLDPFTKPGSIVTTIKAVDDDTNSPNNMVLHVLKNGGLGKFSIDPYTGKR